MIKIVGALAVFKYQPLLMYSSLAHTQTIQQSFDLGIPCHSSIQSSVDKHLNCFQSPEIQLLQMSC